MNLKIITTKYDVRWLLILIFKLVLIVSVNNLGVVAQYNITNAESSDTQDVGRATDSEFESREIDYPMETKSSDGKYTNIQKLTRRKFDLTDSNLEVNVSRPSQEPDSDMEWLLNIYNPHLWNPEKLGFWNISHSCQQDMHIYLSALRNGSIWASKSKYLTTHVQVVSYCFHFHTS